MTRRNFFAGFASAAIAMFFAPMKDRKIPKWEGEFTGFEVIQFSHRAIVYREINFQNWPKV